VSWTLFSYARSRPPRTRARRIAWLVATLLVLVPLTVVTAYAAVAAWRDVLDPPDVPLWLRDDLATVSDAVLATLLACGFGGLTVWLLLGLPGAFGARQDGDA
jgi:ABC-type sulfate transport system permease component